MKNWALCALILAVFESPAPEARIPYFSHVREVTVNAPGQQNYLEVDDEIWRYAQPDLADLRLYSGDKEIPYWLTEEHASTSETDRQAKMLQLGKVREDTSFVIEIPGDDEYNQLTLRLDTKNFVARATVEGMDDIHAASPVRMGPYTLYDFTREGLGSNSTLKLPDSRFRFLRVILSKEVPPTHVKAATVSFREEKKASYTSLSASPKIEQKGKETNITWSSPKNAPLDLIVFDVDQVNFLRNVSVHDAEGGWVGSGEISRIQMTRAGRRIDTKNLTIPIAGARSSSFRATISNGDDSPLHLKAVTPQYVTRRIYFDPRSERALRLYYGDEALAAPSYEYARLATREPNAKQAELAEGMQNAAYSGRPDDRPWSERHPEVLWTAMIVVVAGLGAVALKGLRKPA